MMEVFQSFLLPIAVFLLVTGLWLRLVFPAEREGRGNVGSDKAKAMIASMVPAFAVAAFGGLVSYLTGAAIFATIAFGSGYILAMLLRRSGRRRAELRESRYALTAIETATRVLRAGIPVSGVLEVLARDSQGDTGLAFREVLRREELGEPLSDALRTVLLRSPRPELRAFGMALLVHLDVGGNLVDTCDRLSQSILERARIQRRSEAIVTYGRVAGGVLSIAPFVVVPVLSMSIEGYAEFLFDRPVGNAIIVVALGLVITGAFMMQRMTQLMPRQSGAGAVT